MHAHAPVSVHLFQVTGIFDILNKAPRSHLDLRPIIPLWSLRPAGEWLQAAGRERLLPSWGQQRTRPRYKGLYHSRCWCSWSRGLRRISVHSHHTGTGWHSSSRTSSLVKSLWEQEEDRSVYFDLKKTNKKTHWSDLWRQRKAIIIWMLKANVLAWL